MRKAKKIVKKTQYVIPIGNAWMVKSEGSAKFTIITDNKREAVSFAKEIAKRYESDLIIYDKKGGIAESISYKKKGKVIEKV
jgi:pyruvate/2-oxoglutarate/acetoin dehydrogenase E1 component